MNEYIINPRWFYWVSIAEELKTLCAMAILVGVIVMVLALIFAACDCFDEKQGFIRKLLVVSISILVVSIIGAVFIPSKETLISMMVAKYATHENIQIGIETIKDIVNYIIEGIKSIK